MTQSIRWTSRAKKDYTSILEYLNASWTNKELRKFVIKTNAALVVISNNPQAFPLSKRKNVHKCVLIKQISIYYKVNRGYIELLTFWDNRKKPRKF